MVSTLEQVNKFYGVEEERLKTSKKNCVEFAKTLEAYRHAVEVMRVCVARILWKKTRCRKNKSRPCSHYHLLNVTRYLIMAAHVSAK